MHGCRYQNHTRRVKILPETIDKKAAVENLQKLGHEAAIRNGVVTVNVVEDADINKNQRIGDEQNGVFINS